MNGFVYVCIGPLQWQIMPHVFRIYIERKRRQRKRKKEKEREKEGERRERGGKEKEDEEEGQEKQGASRNTVFQWILYNSYTIILSTSGIEETGSQTAQLSALGHLFKSFNILASEKKGQ